MEEIKDFYDAWEGDLVDYKGKTYRVIWANYLIGGNLKTLKVVNPNPIFPFVRVKTIIGEC